MTRRYSGGLVRALPVSVTTSGTSGVFTVSEAMNYIAAGKWPQNFLTTVLQFTASGTWVAPPGVTSVDYLIVAGGGAGHACQGAGGGGAGGFRVGTNLSVTPGIEYPVVVGAGGTSPNDTSVSRNGANSTFGQTPNAITSTGGGGGASPSPSGAFRTAGDGGSGGGGARTTNSFGQGNIPSVTPAQGFGGGGGGPNACVSGGGGGGGAGANGVTGQARSGGDGGAGQVSTISGISTYYAGGGGGSAGTPPFPIGMFGGAGGLGGGGKGNDKCGGTVAANGTINTGGGGGGGGGAPQMPCMTPQLGLGGSGIVIIRYLQPANTTTYTIRGSSVWTAPPGASLIDYLLIGGGGGGSGGGGGQSPRDGWMQGAGGGAGGFLSGTNYPIVGGQTYSITIGAGGTGGNYQPAVNSTNGTATTFGTTPNQLQAAGGGRAGNRSVSFTLSGASGGSGGGGQGFQNATPAVPNIGVANTSGLGNVPATIPSQGYNGGPSFGPVAAGPSGGGGGGASANGANGSSGGTGGAGATSTISGVSVTYAGGGSGGRYGIAPGTQGYFSGGNGSGGIVFIKVVG